LGILEVWQGTERATVRSTCEREGIIEDGKEKMGQWLMIRVNSEYAREKMWARIHLMPLLQAEEDRDQVRRYYADQSRAKELLGENDIRVYYSDRYGSMIDVRIVWTVQLTRDRFIKPTYGITPSPGGPGDLTVKK
jgi:hypothetical protein